MASVHIRVTGRELAAQLAPIGPIHETANSAGWRMHYQTQSRHDRPGMAARYEADDGGDLEAVTKQLELALLIDRALWIERGSKVKE